MIANKKLDQVGVIFSHELNQSFKNWKLLFILVIYLVFMFWSLNLVDNVQQAIDEKVINYDERVNIYEGLESKFGNLNVAVPFIVGLILLPFITLLMHFNIISDDRLNNRFRFLFTRSTPGVFIFGKFLASLLVLSLANLLFFIISFFYVSFVVGDPLPIVSLFYPWLFITFYSGALAAFYILTSSFFKNTFSSLAWGLFGLFILFSLGGMPFLGYISLFSYMGTSISATFTQGLFTILAFLILSFIYLFLAWLKIRRVEF